MMPEISSRKGISAIWHFCAIKSEMIDSKLRNMNHYLENPFPEMSFIERLRLIDDYRDKGYEL